MDDNYSFNKDIRRFEKEPTEPGDTKSDGGLGEIIRFALIAIAIVLPIRIFVAQPFIVSGTSMIPTFVDKQYIIVDQISYRLREPVRGDVVIFKFPNDPKKYFIKRMIGLPGDTVKIKGEEVQITPPSKETFTLDEPYVKNLGLSDISLTLGDDEYFVMGDNRASSYDSRFWGPLPKDMLVGRALVRLLPFTDIGLLPGDYKY